MSKIIDDTGIIINVTSGHSFVFVGIKKPGHNEATISLTPAEARELSAIIKAHASQAEEVKK